MDLLQNPFHILNATPRDNRRRITELSDERNLIIDPSFCSQARSDLINPMRRLSAEIAWLPGISPKRAEEIIAQLKSSKWELSMWDVLDIESLTPIARSNLISAGLFRLNEYTSKSVAYWIFEIAEAFDEVDPEELSMIINEERVVSGFPEVTDLSAVESEIQKQRRYYRKVIKSALDKLAPKELVEAVTITVESATDDGEEHGPILIADLVDSYEVEAQGFLEKEERNIKALAERLRVAVDAERPDSVLAPMVNQLIQVVKNWDTVAQPVQISTKSRGLDHDASHRVAGLVRDLAIYIFNEHSKLDFSQQLTSMLQEVFAEIGDVAELTAEDANTLDDIAEQQALDSQVYSIKDLVEKLQADVDNARPDSYLSPKVNQLCQLLKTWNIAPEHEASLYAAWLVRDLAIHMFNEYDKLDLALQLITALLDVFADVEKISDHIKKDAKALKGIAADRNKIITRFKEFNFDGNSFAYKGKKYSIKDIRHIGFYRAVTTHKTNFVKTGETEEAHIYLTMKSGKEDRISVDEQGFFFKTDKTTQIFNITDFYSYLSHITFDRRVEFYESQIRRNGHFIYDKCYFYPNDKIVFRDKEFSLESTSFLRGYGYVEMRNKDYGFLDKIKREVPLVKIPQFSTIVDTDVIFHLLEKHFSLRWKS